MKRPTFVQGVVVAALLGLMAAAFVGVIAPWLGAGAVARLVIPGLALGYLLYLLSKTRTRTGQPTLLFLWAVMAFSAWWLALPLPLYLLLHVVALWLVRSLYCYAGVLPALLDLSLSAIGGIAAIWTISRTGSVFLAVWVFFLLQALFVAIPHSVEKGPKRSRAIVDDNFERARRRAEAALTQLITD